MKGPHSLLVRGAGICSRAGATECTGNARSRRGKGCGKVSQPVKALNSILTTRFPDDEEEELQSARNGKLLTGGGDGVFIERYASHLLPLVAASLADEEVASLSQPSRSVEPLALSTPSMSEPPRSLNPLELSNPSLSLTSLLFQPPRSVSHA